MRGKKREGSNFFVITLIATLWSCFVLLVLQSGGKKKQSSPPSPRLAGISDLGCLLSQLCKITSSRELRKCFRRFKC